MEPGTVPVAQGGGAGRRVLADVETVLAWPPVLLAAEVLGAPATVVTTGIQR